MRGPNGPRHATLTAFDDSRNSAPTLRDTSTELPAFAYIVRSTAFIFPVDVNATLKDKIVCQGQFK